LWQGGIGANWDGLVCNYFQLLLDFSSRRQIREVHALNLVVKGIGGCIDRHVQGLILIKRNR